MASAWFKTEVKMKNNPVCRKTDLRLHETSLGNLCLCFDGDKAQSLGG